MASYDIIGNIAIIKGEINGKNKTKKQKLAEAKKLLKIPSVKTVLEKVGNVKGRLRTTKLKYIAGEKNFIVNYNENLCRFKFDIRSCYFSPRLSNDRKQVALKIKKKDNVLVMFAGVGVYPIVIYKYKQPKQIVGVELGKDCCKYALENLRLNKIPDGKIRIIQGDVNKKVDKSLGNPKKSEIFGGSKTKSFEAFDVIMMARPNLKSSFLGPALKVSKKEQGFFIICFVRMKT